MTVAVQAIEPVDFQVNVASYGIVRPRIQSMLVAQVGGQVVDKASNFDEGGYFSEGDVMLTIDPRDYQADVRIAEATLADAQLALAEEQARADQARIDWDRLQNDGEPGSLVLREPQVKAAQARVASAQANLTKTRLDLERTRIRAPFDGRVLRQMVDLGQVVSGNTAVAEFYSVGVAELRLPIANNDLTFLDLPGSGQDLQAAPAKVRLESEIAAGEIWEARLVRTEAAIDDTARQLHVLAHVDDPFTVGEQHSVPLKIGQYMTATIEGRTLSDVIIIPTSAIYQGSYVYVVEDELLQRRDIGISWSDGNRSIVNSGLQPGEQLVTTLLGQVSSGTRVAIAGSRENRRP